MRHCGFASSAVVLTVGLFVTLQTAEGQVWKSLRWEKRLKQKYVAHLDVVYSRSGDWDNTLDIYVPKEPSRPRPVLIWIHGGGWSHGNKDDVSGQLIPFLESDWVVVNINYRLLAQARAPAAVEDCRCALFWVTSHAKEFIIDTARIVLAGTSAGGHLALLTGMLPAGSPLDKNCTGVLPVRAAAILDFYGPALLEEAIEGPSRSGSVVRWIGDRPERRQIARQMSPISHVRPGLPPVFIVHGDADPTVPYEQSVRLQKTLEEAKVPNEFYSVAGGGHGRFEREENVRILRSIAKFLDRHGIGSLNLADDK